MKKTDAEKRADKAYRERRGGNAAVQKTIGATLNPSEAQRISNIISSAKLSNAEVFRRVAARIEQGDDLRRDYDATTNTLI